MLCHESPVRPPQRHSARNALLTAAGEALPAAHPSEARDRLTATVPIEPAAAARGPGGDGRPLKVTGGPHGHSLDQLIHRAHLSAFERHVAATRLLAALALLVVLATGVGPYHPDAVRVVMTAYTLYSLAVFAAVFWRLSVAGGRSALLLHVVDVVWATAATSVSGGASSHTFVLFLFVLAASAYRWSIRGSLFTAAFVIAIISAEGAAAQYGYVSWPFELDTFLEMLSYLVVFAVLFGLIAERLHALRGEAIALGEILERVAAARAIGRGVHETLDGVLSLFAAREIVFVSRESDRRAVFVWRARRRVDGTMTCARERLTLAQGEAFFAASPPGVRTWALRRARRDVTKCEVIGLTQAGVITVPDANGSLDVPLVSDWRSLVVTVTDLPGCWSGRLFLLDPERPPDVVRILAMLQKVVQRVTPALGTLYLLRRLRSRAEANERARIARELHDGIIQSLAVLDVRLEIAARRVATLNPTFSDELEQTRDLLRADRLNLRDLIERLRMTEVDAATLPHELRDYVDRFRTASGIDVRLIWTVPHVDLTPRQCQEVVRIVSEALVNVRRHSGASRIVVRVTADATDWEVIVEDNGRGFRFVGCLTHGELERRREGPRVIRERAAALGGSLTVRSTPTGARLQIVFPRPQSDS
jgi:signal transduction histidine kinase